MNLDKKRQKYFQRALLHWHEHQNFRFFPWKQEKDPYKIWLSEIILQQTRSEQGLPYYISFTKAFPNVDDLAKADEEVVYKMWQGLGYYNRCKNLLATAQHIAENLAGVFPNNYQDIIQLKGIGPYTAAAIASFAFDEDKAVIDGNVYRVLARFDGIETPIDSTLGKKQFESLAQFYLPHGHAAAYNQAIMDLGATICKPANPLCADCPLNDNCKAKTGAMWDLLPIKEKKLKVKTRLFHYAILRYQDQVYIQKRGEGDIWQNLYEFYLIEGDETQAEAHLQELLGAKKQIASTLIFTTQQRLTHQIIKSNFYEVRLKSIPASLTHASFIDINKLKNFAFPKTIISFFDNKSYF